ncbi:MAG: DNA-binding protein WhiA [Erysipelotrichaceae bacterium]|nr:DNA-binding protein WhiA [Erysipelotrichaceae bacterium]
MSFSSDIKVEICKSPLKEGAAKAQLCALFLMRASLNRSRTSMYLSFQTENAAIAKHVYSLIKKEFNLTPQLSVIKKMTLKKNNIYQVSTYGPVMDLLEELTIMRESGLYTVPSYKLTRSEKNARAFLQGAFLAGGSINNPKTTNYHMEISCGRQEMAEYIQKLMGRFNLPAKIIERKGNWVVYLKAGEKIGDFLKLVDAAQSLFEFEDARIQRDFYNQMKRLDNCEVANEMKSIKAAEKQLQAIRRLEESHISVPEKIARVMEIRKKNPEASMVELCDEVYLAYGETITKSGMKHRLAKIRSLAAALEEGKC